MRLIDADALMGRFVEKAYQIQDRHGVKLGEKWLLDYDEIKAVIDNAPTVEPERLKGHWLVESELKCLYYCSNCRSNGYRTQPFCGWCGADMRGDL